MARRRKRGWRRISPERGWIVGRNYGDVVVPAQPEPGFPGIVQYLPLFDFSDIDNDDDGTVITHDKSNWFCIRMLLDIVCRCTVPTNSDWYTGGGASLMREAQLLLLTAPILDITEGVLPSSPDYNGAPFNYSWYADAARLIQTGYGLMVPDNSGPHATAGSYWRTDNTNAGTWKPDLATPKYLHMSWDVSTRFSLTPERACGLLFGGDLFLNGYYQQGYRAGEYLACSVQLRALMQKGRGR